MIAHPAAHPAPAEHAVALGALWFGLFGAPAGWSLQLLASYALVTHACFSSAIPRDTPRIGGLWTIVLVISLVALGVGLAAGATAWRSWHATHGEQQRADAVLEAGEERTRFMALAGLLLSAVFLFGIVLNAVPLFFVAPCG